MTGYKWKPIEDLPNDWQKLASSELAGLFAVWKEKVVTLKDSPAYLEFQARLRREWAIETGIIEGLYDIDRGVTRTLIERGLHASLIAHGDANKPAEEIIPMLKDHEAVVEGLFDFVGQKRELSTSYIKQVHQALTTHQETATGIDSSGRQTQISLLRGDWKKWPNNPTRPDGSVHEYCPPEQVASEMDRLIEIHKQHLQGGVPPEVESAWLHHRFTQIHPFQDGNGRVARALASLVLIRAGWFPFVVHRDDRTEYIDCLEKADWGDLLPLVSAFGRLQKKALNQAIKLSGNVLLPNDSVEQIILAGARYLKAKEENKRLFIEEWNKLRSQYKQVAEALQVITMERIDELVSKFDQMVGEIGGRQNISIKKYNYGLGYMRNAAIDLGTSAMIAERFGIEAATMSDGWVCSVQIWQGNSIQIQFQFDFYTLRNSNWRLACGLAYITIPGPSKPLSSEAFECSTGEPLTTIIPRFKQWLENALILGFDSWRRQL
ncbi:MAG: Fic family protein [Acidobacteria bacterium]|nr:Fic family protein [Acidobacteriota bacterium]